MNLNVNGDIKMSENQGAGVPLTDAELREVLNKMHVGLVTMQARLDDHEKVIEKLLMIMDNLAATSVVPNGFRQPSKKVN
jgi:hypothetical protein